MRFSAIWVAGIVALFAACQPKPYTLRLPDGQSGTPDTTQANFRIQKFALDDQTGKTIIREDLRGKVVVFNFFFTACPTICPTTMGNLKAVQAQLGKHPELLMLSASLTPWHDTPDTLARYAQGMGIRYPQWRLLTGNKDLIYQLSVESCHIGGMMDSPTAPGGIDHSPYVALFDKTGLLRGLYTATDPAEIEELIDDAEALME